MPRLTLDVLLQRAIAPAIMDRESFIEAYRGQGVEAEEARQEIAAMEALKGRRFASLDLTGRRAAMMALLYAEQWCDSFADSISRSNPGESRKERRCADRFRQLRHQLFGPTRFEHAMQTASAVGLRELLLRADELTMKIEAPDQAIR